MTIFIKNLFYSVYRYLSNKVRSLYYKLEINSYELGYRGKNSILWGPSVIVNPKNVFLHDYTRIQGCHTILTYTAKFIIKKYSASAMGLTVVTGNHVPTVGIPQYMLGPSHVNDVEKDVIVGEDVWIGTGVTLLSGANVGRGSVLGAKTIVTDKSEVPPYSVVVGSPARIVAVKFSIDQILKHEQKIYLPEERMTKNELDALFDKYYKNKKVLGLDYNLSKEEERNYQEHIQKMNFRYPNVE